MAKTKNSIFFSVLCEIKDKSQLSQRSPAEDDPPDPQQLRLDRMLESEGVIGTDAGNRELSHLHTHDSHSLVKMAIWKVNWRRRVTTQPSMAIIARS